MKLSKIFLVMSVATLMLGACAKKDSSYAEKYGVNKMGAKGVDVDKVAEADTKEKESGLAEFDVINMQRTGTTIVSTLTVNEKQVQVTTNQSGLRRNSGYVNIDGFTFVYSAVCINYSCNPVYIAVESYRMGQQTPISQLGIRKYFKNNPQDTIEELDRYQKFVEKDMRPLIHGNEYKASDMNDRSTMVGFLNLD